MGSLMAGWDSPKYDPNTVNLERNKSFTKEEIEHFWQSQKPSQRQQHEQHQFAMADDGATEKAKASLVPRFIFHGAKVPLDFEKARKTDDWWTRSNWAFLNDTPNEEMKKSGTSYVAQFDVGQLPTSKCTPAN